MAISRIPRYPIVLPPAVVPTLPLVPFLLSSFVHRPVPASCSSAILISQDSFDLRDSTAKWPLVPVWPKSILKPDYECLLSPEHHHCCKVVTCPWKGFFLTPEACQQFVAAWFLYGQRVFSAWLWVFVIPWAHLTVVKLWRAPEKVSFYPLNPLGHASSLWPCFPSRSHSLLPLVTIQVLLVPWVLLALLLVPCMLLVSILGSLPEEFVSPLTWNLLPNLLWQVCPIVPHVPLPLVLHGVPLPYVVWVLDL